MWMSVPWDLRLIGIKRHSGSKFPNDVYSYDGSMVDVGSLY